MLLNRRRLARVATLGAALGIPGCAAGAPDRPGAPVPEPVRIAYGPDPSQYGDLHLPNPDRRRPGLVVVIHGGFWRSSYGAELGTPLAAALAADGIAAWNVEYRRLGDGGGWPATFDDVAAAVDALAGPVADAADRIGGGPADRIGGGTADRIGGGTASRVGGDPAGPAGPTGRLDLDRVVALGHSAGGQLAAWLAGRPKLPPGTPGEGPAVRVRGVVSQAGVLDLVAADTDGLGGGSATALLGGPADEVPERYRAASPIALLPLGVPVVCVHGDADRNVPLSQSESFTRAARQAGDGCELVVLPGVDHFALIDPETDAWRRCRDAALRLIG